MIKEFYNMDCMELMKSMEDKSIDLLIADIPYGLDKMTNLEPASDARARGEREPRKRANLDELLNSSYNQHEFDLNEFIDEALRITKGTIIIFGMVELAGQLYTLFKEKTKDGQLRDCIWQKTNALCLFPKLSYRLDTEHLVVYKFPKATFNGYYVSSVFSYPMESGVNRIHPFEKSHRLLKQLIEDNTNKGDIVFDPCMGSGSTCLVALQTGRQTIGCEIDKEVYNKALERIRKQGVYQYNLLEDIGEEEWL